MAQRVIFFSGLGADENAFRFLDLGEIEPIYINWIEPNTDETLHDYAMRLTKNVFFQPDDVLIGLSMGGMVAQEVAAANPVKKVILISSLRSGETLQPLFTMAQKLRLLDLVQKDLLKSTIVNGAKLILPLKQDRIKVIVDMLDQFSGRYYKWAMNAVLNWQGANVDCPVHHVHGDKDEIFPIAEVKNAEIIKGGRHLMITMKSAEVSRVVRRFLDE